MDSLVFNLKSIVFLDGSAEFGSCDQVWGEPGEPAIQLPPPRPVKSSAELVEDDARPGLQA